MCFIFSGVRNLFFYTTSLYVCRLRNMRCWNKVLHFFYRCTVHFEIYPVHSPTNALYINLVKTFKFTSKYTTNSLLHDSIFSDHHQGFSSVPNYLVTECFKINITLVGTEKAPWWWSLKTETCRSDVIVYVNLNLKLLTKLINSAFVGEWTGYKFFTFRICNILNIIQVYFELKFQDEGKGKAIPLQAWRDPNSARRLRLPDFKTIGIWR